MHETKPEHRAIEHVIAYLGRQGFEVENRSRDGKRKGFDLIARRGGKSMTIEVKGATREWGIPDPYSTEFDSQRRLVADYLYIVYFLSTRTSPLLCAIPRDAIDPSYVTPRQGYRISGKFKNARMMQRFVVDDAAGDQQADGD